ncbi:glutathione S-transferase [Podospora appendiculata]|uniref:Glutathione S-transferase n=1 Tax=Podospora appendiculata TaxID=314037 RepID=A0AAE1CCW8_9PEZI|nr:glutathione S-transferase [Podospora appendiculata]
MAPIGKIYTYPNNFRVQRAQALAALNGHEIEIDPAFVFGKTNKTPEFLAKFPMGKTPAFESADGFCLAEGHAICRYAADSGPNSGQLLGSDAKARARVEEWSCFAEHELVAHMMPPLYMCVLHIAPFDEARYAQSVASLERALKRLAVALADGRKFLVGDHVSMADVMVAGPLMILGKHLMDREMRALVPSVVEYLKGLLEIPEVGNAFEALELCEVRVR